MRASHRREVIHESGRVCCSVAFAAAACRAGRFDRLRRRRTRARPIRLIIAVPPGGAADFTARIVGQKLAEALGQNVVGENRGGAGGTIASDITAKASPDGHTLLWSSSTTHGVGPVLYARLPYDALKDFTHIALATSLPMFVVAHQSVPVKSVKELVALAKAKPDTLHFYSSGSGGMPHLVGEMFKAATGVADRARAVQGQRPGRRGPRGGQRAARVRLAAVDFPARAVRAAQAARDGRQEAARRCTRTCRAWARSAIRRWTARSGTAFPGRPGIPKPVVDRISAELKRILGLPDVKERFAQQGADATFLPPDEFVAFMKAEWAKWGPVVKATGARAD